jgi:hypothetical protein
MSENEIDPLAAARPTINPYRTAASLVYHRLMWDLLPKSWVHRRRLKALKDSSKAKKALILCNGPSLNQVDFDSIRSGSESVVVFGLNKINLLFSRTTLRPDMLVSVNDLMIEQNADFYEQTALPVFLNANGRRFIADRENVFYLPLVNIRKFARDISVGVNPGYTVTFVAMQVAFHLGIRDVALVGCDHSFASKGPANKTIVSSEIDKNHFDPNYTSASEKWQLPDLAASEDHYSLARDVYAGHGGRVVNCTNGGNLEIFQRMELSEWLKG